MSSAMTLQAFSPPDLAPRITSADLVNNAGNSSPPAATPSGENLPEVISNGAFSKTWVLPPRKKPGRKAANDVPPTKRQAQNRAAQKAFRDRKAQRVIELEKENDELRERLEQMEAELNILRTATANEYQQPGQFAHNTPSQQLASPAPSGGGPHCDTCIVGKDCACINNVTLEMNTTPGINIPETPKGTTDVDEACGFCSTNSCICKDLGIRETEPQNQQPATPPSPSQGMKRKRGTPPPPLLPGPDSYPMEIDFTNSFTNILSPISRKEGIPSGGCGFCSESTPCVCLQNTLPPLQSDLSSILPEVKAERSPVSRVFPQTTSSISIGCTGEPGTCLQCRMDPMSTLFCQTLSKKLETPISSVRSTALPKKEKKKEDTYLPCSAVYQTLSRHHNFNKMSLELIVDGLAKGEHRGMEFAVGGLQGLLKEMDKGEISQEE